MANHLDGPVVRLSVARNRAEGTSPVFRISTFAETVVFKSNALRNKSSCCTAHALIICSDHGLELVVFHRSTGTSAKTVFRMSERILQSISDELAASQTRGSPSTVSAANLFKRPKSVVVTEPTQQHLQAAAPCYEVKSVIFTPTLAYHAIPDEDKTASLQCTTGTWSLSRDRELSSNPGNWQHRPVQLHKTDAMVRIACAAVLRWRSLRSPEYSR